MLRKIDMGEIILTLSEEEDLRRRELLYFSVYNDIAVAAYVLDRNVLEITLSEILYCLSNRRC